MPLTKPLIAALAATASALALGACTTVGPDYKAPDVLVLLEALPVTPMGKIDKRSLKSIADEAAAQRSEERVAQRQSLREQGGGDFGNDAVAHPRTQET